jgi:hypothetical protein
VRLRLGLGSDGSPHVAAVAAPVRCHSSIDGCGFDVCAALSSDRTDHGRVFPRVVGRLGVLEIHDSQNSKADAVRCGV